MKVEKRNGDFEEVSFDKILSRLNALCNDSHLSQLSIDASKVAQKVCSEIFDGVKTSELDILSSEVAISLYTQNIEYKELASRIVISNHHKNTLSSFSEITEILYNYVRHEKSDPLINEDYYRLIMEHKDIINDKINDYLDYKFDYFGFNTLFKSYLLKVDGIPIERPQHMLMRVALSIHKTDLDLAFETYDYMSNRYFIHATPTLFNAGSNREQFSSCFLLMMSDDSVKGIYETLSDCAQISKYAGGIGLAIHNIRAKDSFIAGTNGISNGIVPMLRVFNDTARYIDQGGGKRNGSFAIYLEPWHADIFDFLELKKNHGNEMERARDLFYGLWICDLFMKRVQNDEMWSLFCPDICPGLFEVHSDEFEKLYTQYESEKKYTKQVKAQELWFAILTSQIETGTPYLVYKDACNRKSNQQNLGTIKSSNLCTEIVEYTDKDETAVCNLASISLKSCLDYKNYSDYTIKIYSKPNCIYCIATENYCKRYNIVYEKVPYTEITISTEKPHKVSFPQIYHKVGINYEYIGGYEDFIHFMKPEYNYERLKRITKVLVKNLNNIIDYNFYPTEKTKRSNFNHRPIGIGIQGFANVLYEMKLSFDTDEAKELNKKIFETIYYGALEKSMEIAKERQTIIEYYKKMLDDLKNDRIILASSITERLEELNNYKKQHNILEEEYLRTDYLGTYSTYIGSPMCKGKLQHDLWNHEVDNSLHDWTELRENIKLYGIRNSLLLAPMPTASTSQILGNYECFEPVMSNIYTRRVLSGEFLVLNDYLIEELRLFNLWDNTMKEKLIGNDGSVQIIESIPDYIKKIYKTAWELKQKHIIDMAADRGKFICQSQSLNLFMEAPNFSKLSSMHFYAWKKGLKTGMYYLRSRPSSKAIQFTLSPEVCDTCSA